MLGGGRKPKPPPYFIMQDPQLKDIQMINIENGP